LIIRNGFIRDEDGDWHNLDYISELRIKGLENRGERNTFVVVADTKISDQEYVEEWMSKEFQSQHEAQINLDNLFGWAE
jgi:hypothetical protein